MPPADETPDPRPYLCIPYWTAPLTPGGGWDTGQKRDLPASVVSYLCPSIHAGAYTPGGPLDVTVDIRNSGDGSATSIATVVVYWADPTVGFAHPHFFAATTVPVPPSRNAPMTVTTNILTATIPPDAPPHICLIVAVSHPQDPAETICNPVKYRHWAQRNLVHAVAAQGAPVSSRSGPPIRHGPQTRSHCAPTRLADRSHRRWPMNSAPGLATSSCGCACLTTRVHSYPTRANTPERVSPLNRSRTGCSSSWSRWTKTSHPAAPPRSNSSSPSRVARTR